MLMCKALMLLVCLSTTSGWLVPMSGAVRPALGPSACRSARMQEADATQTTAAFTEDLLDALAADEPLPAMDVGGVFVTAEGASLASHSTSNPHSDPDPDPGPKRNANPKVQYRPRPQRPTMNPHPHPHP